MYHKIEFNMCHKLCRRLARLAFLLSSERKFGSFFISKKKKEYIVLEFLRRMVLDSVFLLFISFRFMKVKRGLTRGFRKMNLATHTI